MVFSSPFFLSLFFPILLLLYIFAPKSARNAILLLASLFFYAWGDPRALPILICVIIFTWYTGLKLARPGRIWMIIGVVGNLAVLAFFKYLNFAVINLNSCITFFNLPALPLPDIALPIGISFYIFQAISYIIDAYRKQTAIQTSLFKFSLYISLFPQLVAGPIVRYVSIANELGSRSLSAANLQAGIIRFSIGLAKKVFIADSMGYIADVVFSSPADTLPCLWAWIGAITYALQIYYDFSAYSDMAIGIGKIFNFNFPENFNYPYAARTLQDFWRRWHMSLTTWLRDYLYIPLGGNRGSNIHTYRNILIILLCCGVWHGAAWNFFFWGLYNGLGLIAERMIFRKSPQHPRNAAAFPGAVLHALLVLLFILIGWVFFRSDSLAEALHYLEIMFCGNPAFPFLSFEWAWLSCVTYSNIIFFIVALVGSQPIKNVNLEFAESSLLAKIGVAMLFVAAYAFVMTSDYSPFLYFRF